MSSVNQIVGGNFQDSQNNPLSNGYLIFVLSRDEIDTTTSEIEVCAGRAIRIPLDNTGNVPTSPVYSVWTNDSLVGGDTFYTVIAYTAKGERVWGPNYQQVLLSPSPFNIGAWAPTSI